LTAANLGAATALPVGCLIAGKLAAVVRTASGSAGTCRLLLRRLDARMGEASDGELR
jgi:hypothetical protein